MWCSDLADNLSLSAAASLLPSSGCSTYPDTASGSICPDSRQAFLLREPHKSHDKLLSDSSDHGSHRLIGLFGGIRVIRQTVPALVFNYSSFALRIVRKRLSGVIHLQLCFSHGTTAEQISLKSGFMIFYVSLEGWVCSPYYTPILLTIKEQIGEGFFCSYARSLLWLYVLNAWLPTSLASQPF